MEYILRALLHIVNRLRILWVDLIGAWLRRIQWKLEIWEEKSRRGKCRLRNYRLRLYQDPRETVLLTDAFSLFHPSRKTWEDYNNRKRAWSYLAEQLKKEKYIFEATVRPEGDPGCYASFLLSPETAPTAKDFLFAFHIGHYNIYRVMEGQKVNEVLAEFKKLLKDMETFLTKEYLPIKRSPLNRQDRIKATRNLRFYKHMIFH